MPTYTFRDKETGEEQDKFLYLSEYDEFLENNKNLERVWTKSAALISGVNNKPSEGFRDILKVIHKRSGVHSKINTF